MKEIAPKYPNLKYLKTNNDSGWFEIKLNNLVYTIATGGLHTQDIPRELKSKLTFTKDIQLSNCKEGGNKDSDAPSVWDVITDNSYVYVHWDIASFYPSLMSVYKIAPAHMNEGIFAKLITWLKDTRVKAKHSKEDYIDGVPAGLLAEALKIVINSIYGNSDLRKVIYVIDLLCLKLLLMGNL